MKRILLLGLMTVASLWAVAQDCEALLLPFFGSAERMQACPPDKLQYHCMWAQAALYESDTVPAGAELHSITEVKHKTTGEALPVDFVVDLNTLSYHAYNFYDGFQAQYHRNDRTFCFSTPASSHPYLVLRSREEATDMAVRQFDEWRKNGGK